MGGIKGTILLIAILGGAGALYLKSSMSTDAPAVMKAETPPERGVERAPPPVVHQEPSRPVDIVPKQAMVDPPAAAAGEPEGPRPAAPTDETRDATARKKIREFHARERVMAGRLKKRCDAGQEKRQHVCAHAERLLRSGPRAGKKPAGK